MPPRRQTVTRTEVGRCVADVEVAVGRLTAPCGGCLGDRRVDLDLLPAHIGSGELKGCG